MKRLKKILLILFTLYTLVIHPIILLIKDKERAMYYITPLLLLIIIIWIRHLDEV